MLPASDVAAATLRQQDMGGKVVVCCLLAVEWLNAGRHIVLQVAQEVREMLACQDMEYIEQVTAAQLAPGEACAAPATRSAIPYAPAYACACGSALQLAAQAGSQHASQRTRRWGSSRQCGTSELRTTRSSGNL